MFSSGESAEAEKNFRATHWQGGKGWKKLLGQYLKHVMRQNENV